MSAHAAATVPVWLNDDFIKQSLKNVSNFEDCSIVSASVKGATVGKENYLSDTFRMTVTLKHRIQCYTMTLSFFIKCLPDGKTVREVAQNMGAFEREISVFTKTLPVMTQLLQSADPKKYSQLAAVCFRAGSEPVDYLMLEDLRDSGYVMAKRSQGLDLAHSRAVVRKLAELHAASIGLFMKDHTCMDNYKTFAIFNGDAAPQMKNFFKNGCLLLARELERAGGHYSKYASKLRAISETAFANISELTKWKKRRFQALIHADCWTNNMMFKYSGGSVNDVILIDFQMAHFSSPSLDLQYFLHTSLKEEVYVSHVEDLLEEYYFHLIETLDDIGVTQENHLSYDDFRQDYEDHSWFSLYGAIAIQPLVRSDERKGFDIEAAINGCDTAVNSEAYANNSFLRCIREMLPVFERKGLL
ncbi:uncharacterized protein LOC126278398 isoform X1 [Schistocerca gregaria]|uniref:uncharacterized protein LOC126278398 isoform X1 n=1 Tax=Schistocerca gregaria TaxID=7010 RepID=UPI00211EEA21|nr:uncharacterized protein LOC126278398 isoform X1 [Schistocerca gregaria]